MKNCYNKNIRNGGYFLLQVLVFSPDVPAKFIPNTISEGGKSGSRLCVGSVEDRDYFLNI